MATYKEYIELGLKRGEWTCNVTKDRHGYNGFYLYKNINKNAIIQIDWLSLDKIELCMLEKGGNIKAKTLITFEQLKDLLNKN